MADQQTSPFEPYSAADPVVAEMVRRLVEVYRPERIYLFGSVARGDAGPDSDYDFMVIVPDDTPQELSRLGRGYRALSGLGVAKDVIVYSATEFDKQLHLKASFPSMVVAEGKLLYAACPDPCREHQVVAAEIRERSKPRGTVSSRGAC